MSQDIVSETARAFALRRCARDGHRTETICTGNGQPVETVCTHCGTSWPLTKAAA